MILDTFFKKFDQFADAPNAVAKMRELVLRLAVRGQLVPQNKRDEPACKAIERLVALNGPGRTAKLFAEAKSVEVPFDVPGSWKWVRLGDLVRIRTGKLDANAAVEGGEYPFFTCSKTPSQIATYSFDTSAVILAGNGDFNLKSYSGKFDAYQRTYVIEPIGWELGFCFWLISAQIKRITDNQRGSAIPYLRLGDITDPLVPFPPLAEQKRIVAKVDELMALCDRLEAQQQRRDEQASALARASLARFAQAPTPANLNLLFHKSYNITPAELRKAILTLAVQGKLVSRCPLPPPSDELKVAKRKLSEKEGIRNRAEVARLDRAEWGHPIPKHWDLPNFDDLLVIVSGVTKGRVLAGRKTETVPYLRVANVQRGYLDLNVIKEIEVLPEDENRYRLETGDVLMTEGGDWDKVGRAAVWRSEVDRCIHQNHVYRIRSPRENLLLPEWVECYVNSPAGRSFFAAASKQTTNLASINMTQLRGCPLPLPPSEEQRRIVAKVDQLMSLVDQLEAQLAVSRATAKNLFEALVVELTCSH